MTNDDYYEIVRAIGITLIRKTASGEDWIARKDGNVTTVPVGEDMTPEEREDAISLLKFRHGIADC